jgi:hypothetical protein
MHAGLITVLVMITIASQAERDRNVATAVDALVDIVPFAMAVTVALGNEVLAWLLADCEFVRHRSCVPLVI